MIRERYGIKYCHQRAALIECLTRLESATTKSQRALVLLDLSEIDKAIQDSARKSKSLKGRIKSVRKRRLSKEKPNDNFEIQTNPNPYLQPNRNYFKDYVLGVWNE